MYATLLSAGILLLSIVVLILNGKFWFEEVVEFSCIGLLVCSAIATIVCVVTLCIKPCAENATINDYVLCKELINSPSTNNDGVAYNVTKLTISVNREIMRNNTYRQSKWLNWFYSEKVGELPILPLVSDPEDNVFENENE